MTRSVCLIPTIKLETAPLPHKLPLKGETLAKRRRYENCVIDRGSSSDSLRACARGSNATRQAKVGAAEERTEATGSLIRAISGTTSSCVKAASLPEHRLGCRIS